MISNPTTASIVEAKLRGERATWPSKILVDIHKLIEELDIIHNNCAIELAIDSALHDLNVKMAFGNAPNQLERFEKEVDSDIRTSRTPNASSSFNFAGNDGA